MRPLENIGDNGNIYGHSGPDVEGRRTAMAQGVWVFVAAPEFHAMSESVENPGLDAVDSGVANVPLRVLLTGSNGAIGKIVGPALLRRGHFVRGLDRQSSENVSEAVVGSVQDAALVANSVMGMDAVVHLAATPDVADFASDLNPNNIIGTHRVLEAAAGAGVRRVVLASTMRVINSALGGEQLPGGLVPFAATDYYALSKICCEEMGHMIARKKNVEVIAARLGWFFRTPADIPKMARQDGWKGGYLSHDDACRFFIRAVEAPWGRSAVIGTKPVRYAAVSVLSANAARPDAGVAEKLIGYVGRDTFPHGLRF